jgi:hypothetical protein
MSMQALEEVAWDFANNPGKAAWRESQPIAKLKERRLAVNWCPLNRLISLTRTIYRGTLAECR